MGRLERQRKQDSKKPKKTNKLDTRRLTVQEEVEWISKKIQDLINKKK